VQDSARRKNEMEEVMESNDKFDAVLGRLIELAEFVQECELENSNKRVVLTHSEIERIKELAPYDDLIEIQILLRNKTVLLSD